MAKYVYSDTGLPVDSSLPITKERDGSQWVLPSGSDGWLRITELVQSFGLVSPAVQATGSPVLDRLNSIETKLDQLLRFNGS